jgi:flavodoxin
VKALIVYDSVFGNTEQIAKAIGDSLADLTSTEVVKVSEAKLEQLQGTGLLIVGSPTRAFKPTKAIVDFLIQIPSNGLKGINVAAFDTRVNTEDVNSRILNGFVRIFGYAAKPIADKMQKKGGNLVLPPEGFFVKDNEGPLKDGELERAAKWAITVMKGE